MLTRLRLAAGFALLATLAAPLAYAQDTTAPATKGARGNGGGPGGGGPGGPGGPGGGGPGGFGGFGGPGGPGGGGRGPTNESVERLVQIEAVQEDLKVDDKTKAKIKSLGEDAVKERTKRRDAVTKLAQAQAAEIAAQQNAAMAEMLANNGIMVDPKTLNNNNNNGGRGGRGGNNGGPGGPGGNNQLERQMMTIAMNALQEKVDAALLKLLDAKQKARLKQIQLQQEGTRAFTDPNQEVVAKLDLTEEQLAAIRDANNGLRQSQRQAMMDLFASFADETGANNNNNNNNGGRGGRGGFPNMANLDPATRAKFDQQNQELQAKNTTASMAAIGQLLTATQKKTYNKMIGDPFDVSKLRQAPGGPGGPGGPGAPPATTTAATKAATPDATPKADAAASKPAAKKSLREARGGN
jgi:hypothetical protein